MHIFKNALVVVLGLAMAGGVVACEGAPASEQEEPDEAGEALGLPRKAPSWFLADLQNATRRQSLWNVFKKGTVEARKFVKPNEVREVTSVVGRAGNGGLTNWADNGKITITVGLDDGAEGTLLHEIFHVSYGVTEFATMNKGKDDRWSEAFCDAFKWYMQTSVLSPAINDAWVENVNRYITAHRSDIESELRHDSGARDYLYPASLVIRSTNHSYAIFQRTFALLRAQRAASNRDILDTYFNYNRDAYVGAPDDPNIVCPSRVIEGKTFLFCPIWRTYPEMQAHCASLGATLATIDSASMNQSVIESAIEFGLVPGAQFSSGGRPVVGLNDRDKEGTFVWQDGSSPQYTNWYTNEPNNTGGNEHCVMLWDDGYWNDIPCEDKNPFICRK